MENINFYDPSLRIRRDWASVGTAAALLAVAATALAVAGLWLWREAGSLEGSATALASAYQAKVDTVAALETQARGLKSDAALERQLLDLQATLAHRQAALQLLSNGALRQNGGYSAVMLALARQSVDGLWLTQVAMDHGALTLRGRTVRPDLIAVYVERLNAEPVLRGHAFRALDIRRPVDDAAPAAVPDAMPPGPSPAPAGRRLAPYVEFSLTGGNGADAGAAAAPAGSRS